jgi:hypothetical protein
MGRKNRFKSTFRNTVIPGTLWVCSTSFTAFYTAAQKERITKIQKGDHCIVISLRQGYYKDILTVRCLSQRLGYCYDISLEELYLNYTKK